MRLLSERCWLHKCFCFHGDQILVVCSPFKMPNVCIFHGVVRVFIQKSGFWLYSRGCIAFPVFHWMHAVMQNCGTRFCDILDMYECFVTVWSRQLLASLADVKSHRSSVLNWRTIVIQCVIKHCVHILLKIALVSSEKNLYCWHNLFYFVINISLLFDTVRS